MSFPANQTTQQTINGHLYLVTADGNGNAIQEVCIDSPPAPPSPATILSGADISALTTILAVTDYSTLTQTQLNTIQMTCLKVLVYLAQQANAGA